MDIGWKSAAGALALAFALGLGCEYAWLVRPGRAVAPEQAAPAAALLGGALELQRDGAREAPATPEGLPAGSRVEREVRATVQGQERPSTARAGLLAPVGPSGEPRGPLAPSWAVPEGQTRASWAWTAPATFVDYHPPTGPGLEGTWEGPLVATVLRQHPCPPVTLDLKLVDLPGGAGKRVVATSPDGRVTGGLDMPSEPLPPARPSLRFPDWRLALAYFPTSRTRELSLDKRFGPVGVGGVIQTTPAQALAPARTEGGLRVFLDF